MAPFLEQFLEIYPIVWLNDLLRYLLAAGVLSLVLGLFAARLAHRRIQQHRASARDRQREFLYSMSTVLIFAAVGTGIYLGRHAEVLKVYDDPVCLGRTLLEFLALVLLHDAYFYGLHRLMHTRWLYRVFHSVHHRSRTPTPWAAYAFAPTEALAEAAILPLAALIMPLGVVAIFLFTTHMILRNVVGHAGVELFPRWWLQVPGLRLVTTTTHHDLHHARGRGNYGLYFTWWDRLFGTEHADYGDAFLWNTCAVSPSDQQLRPLRKRPAVVGLVAISTLTILMAFAETAEARKPELQPSPAETLEGRWVTPGFGSVVHVRRCATGLCAELTWLWDTSDPDVARHLGRNLFSGFEEGEQGSWHKGRIFNPEDGRRYRGALTLVGADELEVAGCRGPFCRRQRWRRLASMPEAVACRDAARVVGLRPEASL